ncbi:hypothetical protein, partial [uncultured Gimesia sp.]|uniref:hypothetical protein n=1 Tax=uncultured Gimesia sp. TaxID=1678688 RepID=UPI000C5CB3BE|nr:hypothetical protein [Gimesia sp.]|tara:strand:+ start:238 stop:444 length:207 start_codon:yes stop_codon:yes gene_type:complete
MPRKRFTVEQIIQKLREAEVRLLRVETKASSEDSNKKKQRGVDWQFKVQDAIVKLKSLYPINQILTRY